MVTPLCGRVLSERALRLLLKGVKNNLMGWGLSGPVLHDTTNLWPEDFGGFCGLDRSKTLARKALNSF